MAELADLINVASVRRAIDPSFTARDLPDDSILDPIFTGPAISDVLKIDPAAPTREGAQQLYVKNALNLFLAARLLPAIRFTTKEDFGDGGGYTQQAVNVPARVAELRQLAKEELDHVVEAVLTEYAETPVFIVVN